MDCEMQQSYDKSYPNRDYQVSYPGSKEFWTCSDNLSLKIV